MTDANSLSAPTTDARTNRPPRTLGGALLTAAIVVGLLVALEQPWLVAAAAAMLVGGALAGRALSVRSAGGCDCRRRVCLPGTRTCVRL